MTTPSGNLVTKRTALVLYGVLLVLPTIVLGGLLWRQLLVDHRAQMAAVPIGVQDAARRLGDALEKRVSDLVEREEQRPFYLYKERYFAPGTIGAELAFTPSPLASGPKPSGILGWFSFTRGLDRDRPELFSGGRDDSDEWRANKAAMQASLRLLAQHVQQLAQRVISPLPVGPMGRFSNADRSERPLSSWLARLASTSRPADRPLPLPVVAINISAEDNIDCMRDDLPSLKSLQKEIVSVQVHDFRLHFYMDDDGTPWIVASRVVRIPHDEKLDATACFNSGQRETVITQGFFIDPEWLFDEMPRLLAAQVLDPAQEFFLAGDPGPERGGMYEIAVIRPVKQLRFETFDGKGEEYKSMRVAVNTKSMEERFRSQSLHFFGVGAMLVLSLVTGIVLLLRSVKRDLESAQRTENFVAAVTHELRTPLSAIRLYGEMLQEGWVENPTKRAEYYRRIVRETGRLETLVERVLEKSQVTSNEARPEAGSLNRVVESLGSSLLGLGTELAAEDVRFELAADLPDVMLTQEGVRSIVTNLVENARKYAPVALGAPGAEPILVVTRVLHGEVVLEVKDRGPGIPQEERSRIFEAFYRIGNETTRTARGTGLGLHLVALQSQTMGARVQVLDRKGGGTIFRVTFRSADAVHT
jgi:two-component system sensor histidine kinase CiaH